MWIRLSLTLFALLVHDVLAQDRNILQTYANAPSSTAPIPRRPVSATTRDLEGDPTGVAHLLVRHYCRLACRTKRKLARLLDVQLRLLRSEATTSAYIRDS